MLVMCFSLTIYLGGIHVKKEDKWKIQYNIKYMLVNVVILNNQVSHFFKSLIFDVEFHMYHNSSKKSSLNI